VRQSAPDHFAAGEDAGLTIEYGEYVGTLPGRIRLVSPGANQNASVDLTVRLSQGETNTELDAAAFSVVVPPDAVPLSLEELRDAGPLGATALGATALGATAPGGSER
jgi:hypothetical protein